MAAVQVNAALAISPSSATITTANTKTFSATGGVSAYTYSVVSGPGTINSSTGVLTPSGAGTIVVRVTDSGARTSDATVTVNAALNLTPDNPAPIAASSTKAFSSTGGVAPITYSVLSGTGSINSATGLYTAAATATTAVIRATDSIGNTSDESLTVYTPLAISPTTASITTANTKTFTASGGVAPYTYSVVSGNATIDGTTGVLTPTGTGAVTVRVTDSGARTSDAAVTIYAALNLTPDNPTSILVNQTKTFSYTGGVPAVTLSVVSGGGSINNGTGVYTAPATATTAVIRATDSIGNTSDETLTVTGPLAISPTTASITTANTKTFTASGGTGPYTYSVVSGPGTINSSTGVLTPSGTPGTITVRVTDSVAATSNATVTVYAAISLSPVAPSIATDASQTFTGSGGVPSLTYSIQSGSGSINSSTGAFTAPSTPGSTVIRVTDSIGNYAEQTATIYQALVLSPATASITTANTKTFTASGGFPAYTYSIMSGPGTVDASGVVTPTGTGTVVVKVTDSSANTATATLTVYAALTLSPTNPNVAVNTTQTFTGAGGVAPLTYSLRSGGGLVNSASGLFTAPSTATSSVIRVTDAIGNTAEQTATIYTTLSVSPSSALISVNTTKTVTSTGGVAPITYSVVAGTGSVDSSTGVYTAPAASTVATVRATDGMGNTADSTITVASTLTISPTSITLAVFTSYTFQAAGNTGANVFSVSAGTGTVNSSTGLYTAPAAVGSATVQVADNVTTKTAAVTIVKPTKVVNGDFHSCALFSNGGVKCWGDNTYGQLGLGNTAALGDNPGEMGGELPWLSLGTGLVVSDIEAGSQHTCVIFTNAKMKCWGRNNYGQLGIGNMNTIGDGAGEMGDSLAYVSLGPGRTVKKIGLGVYSTCAILDDDSLKCWGFNSYGGLGRGSTATWGNGNNQMGSFLAAVDLGTGRYAKDIALGFEHTCALLDNNTVKCWGGNGFGQLGQENTTNLGDNAGEMGDSLPVVNLGAGRTVTKLRAGPYSTCALLDNSALKCWGRNQFGQLGQESLLSLGDGAGEMGDSLPVVNVGTGLTVTDFRINYHVCATLSNSTVKCWGKNDSGQLGTGTTGTKGDNAGEMGDSLVVANLGTGVVASQVAAGTNHSCALTTNDRIKCWGGGTNGVLGTGNANNLGDGPNEMGDFLSFLQL
jgi:alpha-tubulin suppressor-like RCC1 family protein